MGGEGWARLYSASWEGGVSIVVLEILVTIRPSPHLFIIQLFVSVWIRAYFFCTVGNIYKLFQLGLWELRQVDSVCL